MITCQRHHLEARCRERGYTLDEVRACIVSEDGNVIVVDESHPAYPARRPGEPQRAARPPAAGPGTELKAMLAGFPFYLKTTPSCPCSKRAKAMDEREKNSPGWCEENMATIVGWLKEEHGRQKLLVPFVPAAVEQLVRIAIRRARKKATSK